MSSSEPDISLRDFQQLIRTMYFEKDVERGISGTFMWLMEEIGELATALRTGNNRENLDEEFADVFAWLTTIANVSGVNLARPFRRNMEMAVQAAVFWHANVRLLKSHNGEISQFYVSFADAFAVGKHYNEPVVAPKPLSSFH